MYRVQWFPEILVSELAPDFGVVGIHCEMLDKDGVDVAADSSVAVAEDAGDAFQLLPYAVLDVNRMTLQQLRRRKECSLELGEVRFALLLADTLLLRWLGCGGYGCYFGCCLLFVKQIVSVGRCGAVNRVIAVNCLVGVS